ncbi:unnamed protein product [Vicia faba]|uniref:Uncharacterized protein n=1 Tax=Vicia faba TaxID=3906 RepID=A0AAV0YWD8_VICFA|nr:unnamed protein product [Vicia faba]
MKPHFHLHNGYNLNYVLAHVRWRVDIGQIIAIEMKNVAESCKKFRAGTRSAHPLVYPSLIMGLIIASQGEATGHENENDDEQHTEAEEEVEAEAGDEEGTSGGSKAASEAGDNYDEFMGGE